MNKIVKGLTSVASIGLLAAGIVSAQPHGGHGPGGHSRGPIPGIALEQLDLSAEQAQAVLDVNDSYRSEMRSAHKAVRSAREALDKLVASGSSDNTAITTAATAVGNATGDLALIQARLVASVRGLLDEAQVAQLDSEVAARGNHRPVFE